MSSCIIGFPIVSDASAVYVPTFAAAPTWTLPLINLQDRELSAIARSASASIADTQFAIDLKTARRVGVLALLFPIGATTSAATARMRGMSSALAFDSLTVGDAAWTQNDVVHPTVRTPAGFTCADGVPLDLLADTSAVATSSCYRAMTYTGNGTKVISFRIAKSAAYASHRVFISDGTAVVDRLALNIDFTAAAPVVTIVGGIGTIVSTTARGDGSWLVLCTAPAVVAANVNNLSVWPGGTGVAADVAAIYIGDFMSWNAAADPLLYDSGAQLVWPVVYPAGSLPADDPRMLAGGKYSAEQMATLPGQWTVCPATPPTAQYWKVTIDDHANALGYVDVARLAICTGYQPTVNFTAGAKLGFPTASSREESDGGAAMFDEKRDRRDVVFSLDGPEDEMLANTFDIKRQAGITKQMVFVYDSADTYHMTRRSFLGVLKELSALEAPYTRRGSSAYAVIEEI
jgi:hypothetical protein